MPLLSVTDLSIQFHGNPQPVVHHITFSIEKNQIVALIGESGSGKSVTALSILQLLGKAVRYPSGSIRFDGHELLMMKEHQLQAIRGNRIAMIFQEPMTSLNPLHTIEKQISEVLFLHKKITKQAARTRVIELLKLVQLDNLTTRLGAYPHELSGGQRQRVMIAMALACEPELLIADEPTTALDVTVQAGILALLKDIQQKTGMAMLFITHNLPIVRHIADTVCVMSDGHIVEQGPTKQIFSSPTHPYTIRLLQSQPKEQRVLLKANAKEMIHLSHLNVTFTKPGRLFGPKLQIPIISDISVTVKQGHTLGIVGESGSGKSTIALALLKLIKSTGSIVINSHDLQKSHGEALRHLRKNMQIVFQDPFASLNPRMTVRDILNEGLKAHQIGATPIEKETLIDSALTEVGLDPVMKNRYPHEFSGGQRQRIAISRALILRPSLMVLDEPTSALDVSVQAQIIDLLSSLQQKYGLTLVFISHDLQLIRSLSHHVMVLKDGHMVEYAETDYLFTHPQHDYTRMLIESAA